MSYVHANIKKTNKVTFFWDKKDDLQNSDIWIWWKGKTGKGYEISPCEYGAQCTIDVPKDIDHIGFIVRTNCSDPCGTNWGTAHKDWGQDRKAQITSSNVKIYLRSGDGNQYYSLDNGKTLDLIRTFSFAEMIDRNKIRFHISPMPSEDFLKIEEKNQNVKVIDSNGNTLEIKTLYIEGANHLTHNLTNYPAHNLVNGQNYGAFNFSSVNSSIGNSSFGNYSPGNYSGIIELEDNLDISQCYTVELVGYGKKEVVPTQIFDTPWFIENYTYNGNDLGAIIQTSSVQQPSVQKTEMTTFKIWAPTAQNVELNLFEDGQNGEPFKTYSLEKAKKGIWHTTINCASKTYYTYTITTALGKKETADPYAIASGVNGKRSMVIDMGETNPNGFEKDTYKKDILSYSDAVVWEVHVRDFSNKNPLSKYPGKYLAFTEEGQNLKSKEGVEIPIGLEHVKKLGITHVQLNPVFDFATIDESSPLPQFNWGYDPQNFNVPEGSFSTDPYHGEVRINEFKRMVKALHDNNIGVVMDVVYNHTHDTNSSFNKTVPYYYYRYNSNGENSNGSGCGNETASQRYMVRKFIVDSIRFWATEYHIDGFRFDLMAIHDIDTMQEVEKTLHEINPHALLYGEGWTGGTCALDSSLLATQNNIMRIKQSPNAIGSVAVFNDIIRDGLKGNVFEVQSRGYINNGTNYDNANKVCFGLKGGIGTHKIHWSVDNAMVVNYLSSHDNNTLWDKLKLSNINASKQELLQMNKLGATCVLISKGLPFMLAGEEMLRSKNGDGNSYNSSDAVNNLDWQAFVQDKDSQDMIKWYKNLIAMRMDNPFIRDCYVSCNIIECNVIEAFYHKENNLQGYALINPNDYPMHHALPVGKWKPLLIGNQFFKADAFIKNSQSYYIEGTLEVPAKAVAIVSFEV